jgi:hypothetical protein
MEGVSAKAVFFNQVIFPAIKVDLKVSIISGDWLDL